MLGMILRKMGVTMLTILKVILHVAMMILQLLCGAMKLFLLLFAVIVRVVLSMIGMVGRD